MVDDGMNRKKYTTKSQQSARNAIERRERKKVKEMKQYAHFLLTSRFFDVVVFGGQWGRLDARRRAIRANKLNQ